MFRLGQVQSNAKRSAVGLPFSSSRWNCGPETDQPHRLCFGNSLSRVAEDLMKSLLFKIPPLTFLILGEHAIEIENS